MSSHPIITDPTTWALDREIVLVRVLDATREADTDDDPARFRVTIVLDVQADGKTVSTLRQLHPTVQQRDAKIGFGAVELGLQTMQKLADHLGSPESHGR